jgi:LPXTG-motif cell wall-anchored protein
MENNTLLGATGDSTQQYDGSGVFNPNPPNSDVSPVEILVEPEESKKPDESVEENTGTSTNTLLMYGGAALLLYYFFFKKK